MFTLLYQDKYLENIKSQEASTTTRAASASTRLKIPTGSISAGLVRIGHFDPSQTRRIVLRKKRPDSRKRSS